MCPLLRVCGGWEAVMGSLESFFMLLNHVSLRLVSQPSHPFFCSLPCYWAWRWLPPWAQRGWLGRPLGHRRLLLPQHPCWSLGNERADWHGFPGGSDGKESHLQCRWSGFSPWVGTIPWRRQCQPTPVFMPGESHGQRSLASYSPWGCEESDTTERLYFDFSSQGQNCSTCPVLLRFF